ncbi:MAG: TolC family protein [Acidobacteriia bacterium]|nr:TolC family protein [Terriglobia bacterium]
MLKITTEQISGRLVLSVEGRLAGQAVTTLGHCWRELRATSPEQKFSVNLCGVSFIDATGKALLQEIHGQGAQLLAEGCLNQSIVEEITGKGRRNGSCGKRNGAGGAALIFFAFLLLAFAPAETFAQTAPPSAPLPAPLRLTLDQAVALALKQNTMGRIAAIEAAEAAQDKDIARAALLPRADLDVNDNARRMNLETGFGQRFPGMPQHAGPFQIFNAGASFSAPVLDLTLWRRYQAARNGAEAGRQSALAAREQVTLLVVSQYIGTLRSIANVQASESRVALAQALYDQAADLQKAGVGTSLDALRANVELQNEKQRLILAQAERLLSLFGLSRLLNLDSRQNLVLDDALQFFDTPQPDPQASIALALAARPEWKALDAQLLAARNLHHAAVEQRLPSLRFEGSWAYSGISSTRGIPVYNYQASLTLPLFAGGRIHAEAVRAGLEVEKFEQRQADLRFQIALEVDTALVALTASRSEVEVANLGVKLANEEVQQARDRFQAGVAGNIEVISAQDALARASDNQIGALYRFNQSRADFARATGQMEKLYGK